MEFGSLYNSLLIEELEKKDEIINILKVFFISLTSNDTYEISTDSVLDFVNNKFNLSLDFKTLSMILDKIKIIDSFDESSINLYNPDNEEEPIEGEDLEQEESSEELKDDIDLDTDEEIQDLDIEDIDLDDIKGSTEV